MGHRRSAISTMNCQKDMGLSIAFTTVIRNSCREGKDRHENPVTQKLCLTHKAPATKSPTCDVELPIFPAARLLILSRTVLITASSITLAGVDSPKKSRSI